MQLQPTDIDGWPVLSPEYPLSLEEYCGIFDVTYPLQTRNISRGIIKKRTVLLAFVRKGLQPGFTSHTLLLSLVWSAPWRITSTMHNPLRTPFPIFSAAQVQMRVIYKSTRPGGAGTYARWTDEHLQSHSPVMTRWCVHLSRVPSPKCTYHPIRMRMLDHCAPYAVERILDTSFLYVSNLTRTR